MSPSSDIKQKHKTLHAPHTLRTQHRETSLTSPTRSSTTDNRTSHEFQEISIFLFWVASLFFYHHFAGFWTCALPDVIPAFLLLLCPPYPYFISHSSLALEKLFPLIVFTFWPRRQWYRSRGGLTSHFIIPQHLQTSHCSPEQYKRFASATDNRSHVRTWLAV